MPTRRVVKRMTAPKAVVGIDPHIPERRHTFTEKEAAAQADAAVAKALRAQEARTQRRVKRAEQIKISADINRRLDESNHWKSEFTKILNDLVEGQEDLKKMVEEKVNSALSEVEDRFKTFDDKLKPIAGGALLVGEDEKIALIAVAKGEINSERRVKFLKTTGGQLLAGAGSLVLLLQLIQLVLYIMKNF